MLAFRRFPLFKKCVCHRNKLSKPVELLNLKNVSVNHYTWLDTHHQKTDQKTDENLLTFKSPFLSVLDICTVQQQR
jgi:hypothetical protein